MAVLAIVLAVTTAAILPPVTATSKPVILVRLVRMDTRVILAAVEDPVVATTVAVLHKQVVVVVPFVPVANV